MTVNGKVLNCWKVVGKSLSKIRSTCKDYGKIAHRNIIKSVKSGKSPQRAIDQSQRLETKTMHRIRRKGNPKKINEYNYTYNKYICKFKINR